MGSGPDGATPAELERSRLTARRQLETRLQDNDYWMERIGLFDRLGIPLDRIVAPYDSEGVSGADVAAAARKFLPKDVYIQITALPSDTTYEQVEDSTESGGGR